MEIKINDEIIECELITRDSLEVIEGFQSLGFINKIHLFCKDMDIKTMQMLYAIYQKNNVVDVDGTKYYISYFAHEHYIIRVDLTEVEPHQER